MITVLRCATVASGDTKREQMTTSDSRPRRSRWLRVAVTIIVVVAIVAVIAAVWYVLFRPAGPPPIGPDAPTIPDGASAGQSLMAALGLAFF
jgi:hypothetical protein